MSDQTDAEAQTRYEAARYAEALSPFRRTLRVWDALLDGHPDGCPCQLCEGLCPVCRVFQDQFDLLESGARGGTRALLDQLDPDGVEPLPPPQPGAMAAALAAGEARPPRGGYF
jgi:hypothetical protein